MAEDLPSTTPPTVIALWSNDATLRPPRAVPAIATRRDRSADRYRAGTVLASLVLTLREPTG